MVLVKTARLEKIQGSQNCKITITMFGVIESIKIDAWDSEKKEEYVKYIVKQKV